MKVAKYARWLLAWILYAVGNGISKLDRFEWTFGLWYWVYSRCMCWSADIQGPGDFGPWSALGR